MAIEQNDCIKDVQSLPMIWQVTIKMLHIPPELLDNADETALNRLLMELTAILQSSNVCRHVCRYLGLERRGDKLMLAALKEGGETLSAHIRKHQQHLQQQPHLQRHPENTAGGLPLPHALGILQVLARAVKDLHHRGISDLGLNPDSILVLNPEDSYGVTGIGSILISDLGLSRVVALRSTAGGKACNAAEEPPANYQPPEKMNDEPSGGSVNSGPMCDIWALACLMVHMVTGKAPLAGLGTLQIMCKVRGLR